MKKTIPYIFIIIGVISLGFGGIKYITNDNKSIEEKPKEDKTENDEIKKEIEIYLSEKYNEEFEVVELAKTFCLEDSETNFYPTENCSDKKIKNEIYKVKDSNNISFYVKKVSYDESKIILSREEDINSQSIGLYDTYINFYLIDKLNTELENEYKTIFENDFEVEIYKGLGIENLKYSDAYLSLGKDTQEIKDKTVTLQSFVSTLNKDNSIGIHIKLDTDITKENFQEIVKKLKEENFLNRRNYLEIDTLLLSFNNDNRYIEYKYGSFIKLKSGEDIYDPFNENIYDKTIVIENDFSSNGINYMEFINIDKNSFVF